MNPVDWIILGVVLLTVGAAVFLVVRRKKRGGSCSCGCDSCSQHDCCSKNRG